VDGSESNTQPGSLKKKSLRGRLTRKQERPNIRNRNTFTGHTPKNIGHTTLPKCNHCTLVTGEKSIKIDLNIMRRQHSIFKAVAWVWNKKNTDLKTKARGEENRGGKSGAFKTHFKVRVQADFRCEEYT